MSLQPRPEAQSEQSARERFDAICAWLAPWRSLAEAHVVDLCVDRHWERCVPEEWREPLLASSITEIRSIPAGVAKESWPESLRRFVREAQAVALAKRQERLDDCEPPGAEPRPPLHAVFLRAMKPKKAHEVELLSAFVFRAARRVGARTVLDMGAGQGFVSMALAFHYGLDVVCVEMSADNTRRLRERAARALAEAQRRVPGEVRRGELHAVTSRVMSSCDLDALFALVAAEAPDAAPLLQRGVLLLGLHPCGDLSANLLRMYGASDGRVAGAVLVGCCYNLITEPGAEAEPGAGREYAKYVSEGHRHGFPCSAHVRPGGYYLGYRPRMLAASSPERWEGADSAAQEEQWRRDAFRAALEVMFREHYPQLEPQERHIPTLPKEAFASFPAYARAAMARAGRPLPPALAADAALDAAFAAALPAPRALAAFDALRAALAPALESLVVLDRLLFLHELRPPPARLALAALFDPLQSPRNFLLAAFKAPGPGPGEAGPHAAKRPRPAADAEGPVDP